MGKEINLNTVYMDLYENIVNSGDTSLLGVENHAETWKELMWSFTDKVADGRHTVKMAKSMKYKTMEARVLRVKINAPLYFSGNLDQENEERLLKLLQKDRVRIDPKKDVKVEEERIARQIKAMESELKRKARELEQDEEQESKPFDAAKQLFDLENIIDSKYKLTPSETTMNDYVLRLKQAKEIINRRQNNG